MGILNRQIKRESGADKIKGADGKTNFAGFFMPIQVGHLAFKCNYQKCVSYVVKISLTQVPALILGRAKMAQEN